MFVRQRWPQSFYCWLFCRFAREDAAADYECAHGCQENPNLYLLHSGVLHRVTPPRAIIDLPAHQVLRSSSGNLARFAAIRLAPSGRLPARYVAASPRLLLLGKPNPRLSHFEQ
jgi:hypothetical protein